MIIEFNPFQKLFNYNFVIRIQKAEEFLLEALPQTERDFLKTKGIETLANQCSANPRDPYFSFTFTPIGKPILKQITIQCSIGQKTIKVTGKRIRKLESIGDIRNALNWAIKKLTR